MRGQIEKSRVLGMSCAGVANSGVFEDLFVALPLQQRADELIFYVPLISFLEGVETE